VVLPPAQTLKPNLAIRAQLEALDKLENEHTAA
jgi:hypothetical protein